MGTTRRHPARLAAAPESRSSERCPAWWTLPLRLAPVLAHLLFVACDGPQAHDVAEADAAPRGPADATLDAAPPAWDMATPPPDAAPPDAAAGCTCLGADILQCPDGLRYCLRGVCLESDTGTDVCDISCRPGRRDCEGRWLLECHAKGNAWVRVEECPFDCLDGACQAPPDEVCNGEDDDGDGRIDEDLGVGDACTAGTGACTAEGRLVCDDQGGVRCDARPAPPAPETCNGEDDDCDGQADEETFEPCYDGPEHTAGVGLCRPGRRACGAACEGQVLPTEEVCDTVDNDCDGDIDERFDLRYDPENCGQCGRACARPNAEGRCHESQCELVCLPGHTDCNADPTDGCEHPADTCPPDICNGEDDDGDGEVDEDFVPEAHCGEGICAATATPSACVDGVETPCQPGEPLAETDTTCDALDDDCDGLADEDYEPQTCGTGACAATATPSRCVAGEETPCQPGPESPETCNALDDDCDADIDEGFGLGDACVAGIGACAAHGTFVCAEDGGARCSAEPGERLGDADATCDGVDDDCDGAVDEDSMVGERCNVGMGACSASGSIVCDGEGGTRCEAGAVVFDDFEDGVVGSEWVVRAGEDGVWSEENGLLTGRWPHETGDEDLTRPELHTRVSFTPPYTITARIRARSSRPPPSAHFHIHFGFGDVHPHRGRTEFIVASGNSEHQGALLARHDLRNEHEWVERGPFIERDAWYTVHIAVDADTIRYVLYDGAGRQSGPQMRHENDGVPAGPIALVVPAFAEFDLDWFAVLPGNPADARIGPEICDGIDNDCNGEVDDVVPRVAPLSEPDAEISGVHVAADGDIVAVAWSERGRTWAVKAGRFSTDGRPRGAVHVWENRYGGDISVEEGRMALVVRSADHADAVVELLRELPNDEFRAVRIDGPGCFYTPRVDSGPLGHLIAYRNCPDHQALFRRVTHDGVVGHRALIPRDAIQKNARILWAGERVAIAWREGDDAQGIEKSMWLAVMDRELSIIGEARHIVDVGAPHSYNGIGIAPDLAWSGREFAYAASIAFDGGLRGVVFLLEADGAHIGEPINLPDPVLPSTINVKWDDRAHAFIVAWAAATAEGQSVVRVAALTVDGALGESLDLAPTLHHFSGDRGRVPSPSVTLVSDQLVVGFASGPQGASAPYLATIPTSCILARLPSCAGRPDGVRCDDGDPTTEADHCESGECVGTPVRCEPRNEACNGIDDDCDGEVDEDRILEHPVSAGIGHAPELVRFREGFAVTWSTREPGEDNDRDYRLYYATLDREGLVNGQPEAVEEGLRPLTPQLASYDDLVVMVWQRYLGNESHGFRATASEEGIGEIARLNDPDPGAHAPDIAADGNGFGVVWYNASGPPNLWFVRLDTRGMPVARPHLFVREDERTDRLPAVAATAAGFGVAWMIGNSRRAEHKRIAYMPLSPEGVQRGPGSVVVGDVGQFIAPTDTEPRPAIASDGPAVAISWVAMTDDGPALRLARLDEASREPLVAPLTLAAGAGVRFDRAPVAWIPERDAWAVAWSEGPDGAADVHVALVGRRGGIVEGPIRVTSGEGDSRRPAIAWNGRSLGVAYSDDRDGTSRVWFARVHLGCPE